MNIDEINRKSWELAIQTMMIKKNKCKCASKGKLREIYEKTQGKDYMQSIREVINTYTPLANLLEEAKVIKTFGNILVNEISGMEQVNIKQLMQYVLWNTEIFESSLNPIDSADKFRDNMKLRLSAEGIVDDALLNKLTEFWQDLIKKTERRDYGQKPERKKSPFKKRWDRSEYPGYKGGR